LIDHQGEKMNQKDVQRESVVVARRTAGESFTSIAKDLGVTRQRVHQIYTLKVKGRTDTKPRVYKPRKPRGSVYTLGNGTQAYNLRAVSSRFNVEPSVIQQWVEAGQFIRPEKLSSGRGRPKIFWLKPDLDRELDKRGIPHE
jgi:transposase